MKKSFILLFCSISLFNLSQAQLKKQTSVSGNPILNGWYADPEAVIFENNYWIYPTYSDKYAKQVFLDAFSSNDLIHWIKHEKILDTGSIKWAKKALWGTCAQLSNAIEFTDVPPPMRPTLKVVLG